MRNAVLALTTLTSWVLVAALAPSAHAEPPEPVIPSLSTDQVNRLNAGEVLVEMLGDRDRPIGDVMGVIRSPAPPIAEAIEDCDNYEEFMPDMAEGELLRTEGGYDYCRGVADTPWPMEDRRFVVRARSGSRNLDGVEVWWADWDYVPDSGNLVDTEGYWLLIPWGDDGRSTLVRYYLIADIGTWVPDFLMSWATENMLPETIVALRERVGAPEAE